MDSFTAYESLTVETLPDRLKNVAALSAQVGDDASAWKVDEIGDGNLNLVFIVTGPRGKAIVKQALPYVRLVGDSWPLPLYRAFFEFHALSRQALEGFLSGFVDLVFEHEGAWYVIDWKSNHLGNRPEDYGRDAVWEAMCEHDYVLQYHLYVLALHRYLAWRLGDAYDMEKHLGGVWYVFLRGVDGSGNHGFFRDRPPRGLIEALDEAIGGKGRP